VLPARHALPRRALPYQRRWQNKTRCVSPRENRRRKRGWAALACAALPCEHSPRCRGDLLSVACTRAALCASSLPRRSPCRYGSGAVSRSPLRCAQYRRMLRASIAAFWSAFKSCNSCLLRRLLPSVVRWSITGGGGALPWLRCRCRSCRSSLFLAEVLPCGLLPDYWNVTAITSFRPRVRAAALRCYRRYVIARRHLLFVRYTIRARCTATAYYLPLPYVLGRLLPLYCRTISRSQEATTTCWEATCLHAVQ